MNLHEFQAKELFRRAGLPVSKGRIVTSAQEAAEACQQVGGKRWVAKVQVHAGGRGKVGGVKLVDTVEKAQAFCEEWLGKKVVTKQTTDEGQLVQKILIEECTDISTELYFSILLDRDTRRIAVLASTEGGVDIEAVAEQTPEKIHQITVDPTVGPQSWEGRLLAKKLGFNALQSKQFSKIYLQAVKMFDSHDLELVEINPLVVTEEGNLHCLDAKISVDEHCLFRQKEFEEWRDWSQEEVSEAEASKEGMSFVDLDGNIGCLVNGAGLAMATMDLIALEGGKPANFLDVGGRTNAERVAKAFNLILENSQVKSIFVNIFGGIVRCDLIAEGILKAVDEVGLTLPVVVRLEGTQSQKAREILQASAIENIKVADSLKEGGKLVVELAK